MKKEKEKQEKTVENIEEHTHEHNHDHAHENIKVAFFLNLIFAVIETIGGFLTNSVSIFSDAVHDLGDSISIGISYLFEKKSKKIPNSEYTYGYLRYSLLGAFVTSVVLLVGSVAVLFNAIPRLWNPQEINHDAMIIFAIFGLLINGYAAYKTSKGQKTNEKAINLHMLEDVFGWVIVLIGSICIKVFNQPIIDPILSIFLSLYVLFHVYKYFKDILDIIMEKTPKGIKVEKIEEEIAKKYDTVKDMHHTHIWTLDGLNNCLTAHIKLNKQLTEQEITKLKKDIKNTLKENKITHVTLEIEYQHEKCDVVEHK